MTTEQLFSQMVEKRGWYKSIGLRPQNANTYKMKFQKGELGEAAMSNILTKLGYEKTVIWKKKST